MSPLNIFKHENLRLGVYLYIGRRQKPSCTCLRAVLWQIEEGFSELASVQGKETAIVVTYLEEKQ
jgi:hypothetical protein